MVKSTEVSKSNNKKNSIRTSNISDPSKSHNDNVCIICAGSIEHFAIGSCNHTFCFKCCLRSRVLYNSKLCPVCKSELNSVVFTDNRLKQFQDFKLDSLLFDSKLGVYFDNHTVRENTFNLLAFNCPLRECNFVAEEGYEVLKAHVFSIHNKNFCEICVEFKKVFFCEHTLYNQKTLQQHFKSGTFHKNNAIKNKDDGFRGHPYCKFCKLYLYDSDALFEHCRKNHEVCFICKSRNPNDQGLYRNYDSLEQHFSEKHFLCKEKSCLEEKFQVFASDIDLRAHEAECHPEKYSGQRSHQKHARQINIDFSYSDRNPGSSNSSRSHGRARAPEASQSGSPSQETDSRRLRIPTGFGVITNPPREPPSRTPEISTISPPIVNEVESWPDLSGSTIDSSIASNNIPTASRISVKPTVRTPDQDWPGLPGATQPSNSTVIRKKVPPKSKQPKDPITTLSRETTNRPVSSPHPSPGIVGTSNMSESDIYIPISAQEQITALLKHKKDVAESTFKSIESYRNGGISAHELIKNLESLFTPLETRNIKASSILVKVLKISFTFLDENRIKKLQTAYDEYNNTTAFPELPSRDSNNTSANGPHKVLVIKGSSRIPSRPKQSMSKTSNSSPSSSRSSVPAWGVSTSIGSSKFSSSKPNGKKAN